MFRPCYGLQVDRRDVGAWLSGPKGALAEQGIDLGYAGQRLGLPQGGPGSAAPLGRRILALLIDWLACLAVARMLEPGPATNSQSLLTLELFFAQVALLTSLGGASFGQRLLGIGIRRIDGSRVSVVRVVIRTALICLVIPALVWDRDRRGLHDIAVGTIAVRTGLAR